MGRRFQHYLIGSVALACFGSQAYAQQTDRELAVALREVAARSNVEVLFDPALVVSRKVANRSQQTISEGGRVQDELAVLLVGTGLQAVQTGQGVFVVQPMSQASVTPSSTARQAGSIAGIVTDTVSGASLTGVVLRLEETGQTAVSDGRGVYRFPAVAPGKYLLSVEYLGSLGVQQPVTVEAGGTIQTNITLNSSAETVYVYAQRSSQQQALNQQRAASNSQTVIAADLLGSFPAETVAEALRRAPGVAFERNADTGEGSRVSVRGFNSEAINIQVNGLELQGTGIERSIDLSGFLADSISRITIQKSLLPSMEADGSGGLIQIETKTGLDYGKRYFAFSAENEFSPESAFGNEQQYNATAAWKFNPRFGVAATLQFRQTDRSNYNATVTSFLPPVTPVGNTLGVAQIPSSRSFPFDPEFQGRLITGVNYFERGRESESLTASVNFAWQVTATTFLKLDIQKIRNNQSLLEARTTMGFTASATEMPIPELNGQVRRRTYLSDLRPGLGLTERGEDLDATLYSFKGETDIGRWQFEYGAGYSLTISDKLIDASNFQTLANTSLATLIDAATIRINPDDDTARTLRVVDGGFITLGDGLPVISLSDAGKAFVTNAANYGVISASIADTVNESANTTLRGKARYSFQSGWLDYIEAGLKYELTERSNQDDLLSNTNLTLERSFAPITGIVTPVSSLSSDPFRQTSLGFIGGGNNSVPFLRPGLTRSLIDQIAALTVEDPATVAIERRFAATDRTGDPLLDSAAVSPLTVEETKYAAYVEAKATWKKLEVVGGVRFERDTRGSTAITSPSIIRNLPGSVSEPRQTLINAGLVSYDFIGGTNETLTPSVLATWRPSPEMAYRFGYFRSTVNPDVRLIARPPVFNLDLRSGRETATIFEPNPDLKATVTDNYDIDLAYYFKKNPGIIRVSGFWKNVENNFSSVFFGTNLEPTIEARVREKLSPLAATRPDLVALPSTTIYQLNRPVNGDGGQIYGVEAEIIKQLDFLPASWPVWLNRFSVLGNVTYTTADFPVLVQGRADDLSIITIELDRQLLNQPQWSGTASLAYEYKGLSARLLYSYQSESATAYDPKGLNSLIPSFDTLDMRISYTLKPKNGGEWVLFFEGDNILKGPKDADVRAGTGSVDEDASPDFFFANNLQFNGGRTFTFGVRAKF
jgi:TonB-dependent receptor